MTDQINDSFFNRQEMESEKFMGETIAFDIRKGSSAKLIDTDILYIEVANLTRPLPWGNYVRELMPLQGKFTTWTKTIVAWETKIGVKLDNKTIPSIQKKYQYLWWVAETREIKKGSSAGKNVTDIYPHSIPTKEEIAKVLEGQEAIDIGEVKQETTGPIGPDVLTPIGETQNLVMSIIDGLTSTELKEQMKDINSEITDIETMKAVGDLMIAGKVKMVAKKYKVQK